MADGPASPLVSQRTTITTIPRLLDRAEAYASPGEERHKLSRLLTKDRVTSFVRAPFTGYQIYVARPSPTCCSSLTRPAKTGPDGGAGGAGDGIGRGAARERGSASEQLSAWQVARARIKR